MQIEGLGARLKEARTAAKLSQAQVAAVLDCTPHTVYRYERADGAAMSPGLETVVTIAKLCDVSLDWLLTGQGVGPASGGDDEAPEAAFDQTGS